MGKRSPKRRKKRRVGVGGALAKGLHRLTVFSRDLARAFRHVATGGASTRARAQRRAARPPMRCSTCRQPLPQSTDWRDHLSQMHPEWASYRDANPTEKH